MSAVIDANLIAALVLPLPYSDLATGRMLDWQGTNLRLLAPVLLEYELAAILRKAVVAQWMTTDLAVEAIDKVVDLGIRYVAPNRRLHERALRWAQRLGHSKAYDAHYLALAEQESTDFWTADRRLANGARQAGIQWVRWIGEE